MSEVWVQHVSGQGVRWKVIADRPLEWRVAITGTDGSGDFHCLPKSEYRECDPPVPWKDVTEEYADHDGSRGIFAGPSDVFRYQSGVFRIMRRVSHI